MHNLKDQIEINQPINISGLKLYPLNLPKNKNIDNLVSFDHLLKKKKARALEVSEEGNVNSIKIVNDSPHNLFIFDGEVILGAKQNRISERSVILKPYSETILSVFCIERGRWQYRGVREFAESKFAASPKMRAAKNLDSFEMHRAQSEVWKSVNEYSEKKLEYSMTEDFDELLNKTSKDINIEENEVINNINCNGFIVVGAGRPFIEIFYSKDILKQYLEKSIRTWIADYENEGFYMSPNLAVDTFLKAPWRGENPVGEEQSFFSGRANKGRSISFNNEFIHGYCYL